MGRFCTAKATHIFFSKKFQHICISLDVNFNEPLTNDVVSFEQLGPDLEFYLRALIIAPDKSGYQENIFLTFPCKHMLWVLIRSTLARHF